jgi:ketopantoate reductase
MGPSRQQVAVIGAGAIGGLVAAEFATVGLRSRFACVAGSIAWS